MVFKCGRIVSCVREHLQSTLRVPLAYGYRLSTGTLAVPSEYPLSTSMDFESRVPISRVAKACMCSEFKRTHETIVKCPELPQPGVLDNWPCAALRSHGSADAGAHHEGADVATDGGAK